MHARPALARRAQSMVTTWSSTRLGALTALGPAPNDVIVERPEGLARGRFAWPPWAIAAVGVGVVLMALVYYLVRLRGGHRR
ncbi:MAG TPA: hypothetical protein VM686_20990 [Polyangiaceae bacterium]|jgi:hypothetical protein|nr:hypothetical protein [Polyangiaceae bacterium]